MTETQKNAPALIGQAAKWVINMSANEVSTEQRTAFESWLAQDPRHGEIYNQAERLWKSALPSPENLSLVPKKGRIRDHGTALGIFLLAGSAYLLPFSEWLADERTGVGEIRKIPLADGSMLTLDSKSSVDIAFTSLERRLILRRGRLMIEVAVNTNSHNRPVLVQNRDGEVRALDTQYVVEQAEKNSIVSVMESEVAVTSFGQPDRSVNLGAGQSVRFDSQQVGVPEAVLLSAMSWTQARLVYDNTPLEQVIADLSRYRRGYLKLDSKVGQLRFTGILPADDPEAALRLLENALPVDVKRHTKWLVRVVAKQP